MNEVTIFEVVNPFTNEAVEHVLINHGNDEFTSMLKSTYDEKQAALNPEGNN